MWLYSEEELMEERKLEKGGWAWRRVAETQTKGFWDCLWDKEEVGAGFVDGGIYGSWLSRK